MTDRVEVSESGTKHTSFDGSHKVKRIRVDSPGGCSLVLERSLTGAPAEWLISDEATDVSDDSPAAQWALWVELAKAIITEEVVLREGKGRPPAEYRCEDCGATMNYGEGKCFVVCSACWEKPQ